MTPKTLTEAVAEAERFIRLAKAVPGARSISYYDPSPEAAAAKRASMDLTRALARMRRPM